MKDTEYGLEIIEKKGKKNIGLHFNRLDYDPNDAENMFSLQWIKENKKDPGTNYGQGILQDLMFIPDHVNRRVVPALVITDRDRLIAATVIQWLGSNVGFAFVEKCLKKSGYKVLWDKKK